MLAAGARPKETKINLMDCICMCSEVEIDFFCDVCVPGEHSKGPCDYRQLCDRFRASLAIPGQ